MRVAAGIWTLILALVAAPVLYAQGYGGGGGGGGGYGDYQAPPATGAGAAIAQLRTARTHAGFAAGSDVISGVLDHLAHVVNCLEGPRGKKYNSKAMNPCQGQGNGVIPDLLAGSGRGQTGAARALALAREADQIAFDTLKVTELARAKSEASRVADLLGQAISAIGQ